MATFSSSTGVAELGRVRGHQHGWNDITEGTFGPDRFTNVPGNKFVNGSVGSTKIQDSSITNTNLDLSLLTITSDLYPIGSIVMWAKPVADIPTGWRLCNGSNGTVDLRGRFVLGSGGSVSSAIGSTGGSQTVTLTEQQMPSHNHTVTSTAAPNHSHTGSLSGGSHTHTGGSVSGDGSHSHNIRRVSGSSTITNTIRSFSSTSRTTSGSRRATNRSTGTVSINNSTHTHTITLNNNNSSHSHTIGSVQNTGGHTHTIIGTTAGDDGAHNNMPPYIVLAFIQRTS